MDKTLLVPLDNTEVSEKMIREADAWAAHLGKKGLFPSCDQPQLQLGRRKKTAF